MQFLTTSQGTAICYYLIEDDFTSMLYYSKKNQVTLLTKKKEFATC